MRPKKGFEVGVAVKLSQADQRKKSKQTAQNRKQASKLRMRSYRRRKGITPRIKLTDAERAVRIKDQTRLRLQKLRKKQILTKKTKKNKS